MGRLARPFDSLGYDYPGTPTPRAMSLSHEGVTVGPVREISGRRSDRCGSPQQPG
jgi:hypothetical protein